MRKFFLLLACLATLLVGEQSHAQDYSNKGRDFWVIYTGHIDGTTSRMALYLTSDQNATGTISVGGNISSFSVTANQVTTFRLTNATTPNNSLAYNNQIVGIGTNKGIHIVSDNPIVVYSHILNSARSGSTLVLPTNVLGREYYVSSYKSNTSNQATRRSEFAAVAAEDNTTIEIKATVADGNNTYPANIPFQVTLNKGDVFQYQSANDSDVTGTYIKSIATASSPCKPIAVFAGSTWTAMGCTAASSGDNLYQELFPLVSWGQEYITAPFISRSYDIFRILVRDPTTVVQVNGSPLSQASLIRNTYYEINTNGNNTSRIITADKPICVVQYLITQNCDGVNADPEMVILNSVEQTLNDITVLSARNDLTPPATNITNHYLNIVVKTSALPSLKIDGAAYTATPVSVPATGYSYLQENVTNSTNINPAHRITCDSGFLAVAYGYGNVESYGYNAGTNVKDLYQFISIHNQFATVNFPATCTGTPFYFSMVFPYQPTQITWKFNGLFSDVTIGPTPAPAYDSTWSVNSRTLYRYRIPVPYTIAAAGTYPIKVIAQNPTPDGCGTEQEIDYEVQVFDPPSADFTFTTNGCTTGPVSFFDNSNAGGRQVVSRYWNFDDGNISAINNPIHTYAGPGSFNVKYSLITDVGCLADTIFHLVNVDNPPAPGFTVSNPACINSPITFHDISTVSGGAAIVKWYWDFGDGSPVVIATSGIDQAHSYMAAGTYTATLKVETTSGCQSTVFPLQVIIHEKPLADFSFPAICLPQGFAQFTDLSSAPAGSSLTGWQWDFGDGSPTSVVQHPTHNYTATGPFSVTLVVTTNDGCQDDTMKLVNTIYAEPQAAFTTLPEICLGDAANFTDNSTAPGSTVTQWSWNFGDGSPVSLSPNPSHTYLSAGTYTVTLNIVSAVGCPAVNNTASHIVIVHPLPSVDFNYTVPTCETKVLNFSDLSVPNAGTIASRNWIFGDGSPNSNLLNPVHTFPAAGTYTVSLQVVTDKGCTAIFSRSVVVSPQPHPGFISPEVCLSDAFAQFTDTSTIATGSINSWSWDFGDMGSGPLNTSTARHPQHRYNAIGNYTATLTITSDKGCISTIAQSFTVNGDIPLSNFNALSPAALCANDSVVIQDASSVNFGSITKVEIYWDNTGAPAIFQTDDLPFPGKIIKHLYPNFQFPLTKTFTIRYRAYSGGTCVNDRIKTIIVNAAPKVQFDNMPDVCLDATPFQVTQARETGGVPGPAGVFSGPGITPGGVFNPAAVGPGTYTILYTFTSAAAGCIDTMSKTITVRQPPVADFDAAIPACEGKDISFSNKSISPIGSITTWTWDFADGSPVLTRNNGNPFTHVFASYGTYTVKLKVTTSDGCVSVQKPVDVIIHPNPKVNFSVPLVACLPSANISFTNRSGIADGDVLHYLWDFGDFASGTVNSSTGPNPSHVYISTGPFNVNLRVTSDAGCAHDTTIILNSIHPQPLASILVDKTDVCIGGDLVFKDNSNPLDGTITQWNWTMDDGNTRTGPTFTYRYGTTGSYIVNLFILNSWGCQSTTDSKTVSVNPYPSVDAGPDKFVLQGGVVTLSPVLNAGVAVTYLWSPSTGLNNPAIPFAEASPREDITYTLTLTSDKGCQASDDVFVKVLKAPEIPNIFSPNGDGIHDKWEINYLESYPGCTVDIYNRYGQPVYHSAGYANPWDGTINGRPMPEGTYYYIVDPKNGRSKMTGYVDILR